MRVLTEEVPTLTTGLGVYHTELNRKSFWPAVWPQYSSNMPDLQWFLFSYWLQSVEIDCELPLAAPWGSLWGMALSWCRCCTWERAETDESPVSLNDWMWQPCMMWFLTFLRVCERILSTRPSEGQDLRWLMPAEEHVIHTLNTGRHSEDSQRFFMSTQVHTQKVKD